MKFSVVIPTLNSLEINQTIAALNRLDYSRSDLEIIIVGIDQPGLIKPDDKVIFDKTERPYTPAEARNRGAKLAVGDCIVFLDSDCQPCPPWLKILSACFEDTAITAVGGGVCFEQDGYWRLADNLSMFYEYQDTLPPGFRKQYPSLNFAIRREIFLKLGGFDESYPKPAGEDFDFTYRLTKANYKIWFEPRASVVHKPVRNSLKDLWKHGYNIGSFSTKIDRRYKGELGLPIWMRKRKVLVGLSPFIALAVTLRVFLITPKSFRYVHLIPGIYLSKLSWCAGAINSPLLYELG